MCEIAKVYPTGIKMQVLQQYSSFFGRKQNFSTETTPVFFWNKANLRQKYMLFVFEHTHISSSGCCGFISKSLKTYADFYMYVQFDREFLQSCIINRFAAPIKQLYRPFVRLCAFGCIRNFFYFGLILRRRKNLLLCSTCDKNSSSSSILLREEAVQAVNLCNGAQVFTPLQCPSKHRKREQLRRKNVQQGGRMIRDVWVIIQFLRHNFCVFRIMPFGQYTLLNWTAFKVQYQAIT